MPAALGTVLIKGAARHRWCCSDKCHPGQAAGAGWQVGVSTELVFLHSLSWGIGRNSPVLGTGEIKLPTNMNLLFFLVFTVISPGLPFFDVGCAYPVDQPQPRCCLHLAVSLLCQAAKDALTTSPAMSHFPLIPAASNQLPQHAPRPLRLRGRARTKDTSACSQTAST